MSKVPFSARRPSKQIDIYVVYLIPSKQVWYFQKDEDSMQVLLSFHAI
jgi:hypothetical protein